MNTLLKGLRNESNYTITENGAPTLKSTLSDLLDFYYHAPAMRGQDVTQLFANAYTEDRTLAIKAAFYLRDVRGGQGERNSFVQVLRWLKANDLSAFEAIVQLVPIYGRWKDILEFVDNHVVRHSVRTQLYTDMHSDNPSLLAKWMPSANTSSVDTVKLAKKWISALSLTERDYRKLLSKLRAKINIIERQMSAGNFGEINYEHVPSRAAALYRKAFGKRDATRYGEYLAAVKAGDKKINAGTLYPYELIQGYAAVHMGYGYNVEALKNVDETIEALWKALPNYADTDDNALGVVDVSSSMYSATASKIAPIFVSVALGIYLAERNHGPFKNNFITFSKHPELITLRNGTLKSKVDQVFNAGVGYDTNIQAVFDMLLRVAIQNRVNASDMPKKIFIFSDMEFNHPAIGSRDTNFQVIERKYRNAGYEMPKLIFWNIDSANKQAPVTQDQNGVYLVSGASPSIMKSALTSQTVTPIDLMLEVLNSDRYAAIEEVLA